MKMRLTTVFSTASPKRLRSKAIMRPAIVALAVVGISANASNGAKQENPLIAASCGNGSVKFNSKTTEAQPTPATAKGEATVYVFSKMNYGGLPTGCTIVSRIGMDGKWVGANCGTSYLVSTVPAGEHHLCADWQPGFQTIGSHPLPSLANLHSEPGKTYYFRARLIYAEGVADITLEPITEDEGKLLIAATPASVSRPKK